MIRINALNDADASLSGGVEGHVTTKEAQEEAAYCLYNKALEFQKQGDNVQAEDVFRQLLQTQFLSKVVPPEEGEESPLSPAQTLKYLAFKNMASIASERKDYHQAMESYLDAVNIDATDVSLWFRMGLVALKLHNYPLARLSFEEGLKCNPKHWPCLDNVITVLYALNDYANCLYYISKALECESYFMKGLVFRDQIYKEHAGLHSFCDEYFINCDQSIYTASYDKEEAQKFIDDALAMREKKREISKLPPLPVLKFQQSLVEFKWKQLGERLISLYDYIKSSNPKISFGCRVDLQMYLENAEKALPEINTDQEKRPLSPTTASSSFDSIASTSPTSVPSSQNNEQLQLCSQEQVLVEEPEPQVLMEIEETPLGCSVVTTPNVEVKSSQQEVIPYLDAASLPIVCSRRRGPKRKRLLMESMECGIKRRSARVRNTGKKHQEHSCVNYQDLLKKFLPSTLNDTKEQDEENGAVNDLEASLYETDRNLLNGSQDDQNKSTKTVITLNSSEVDDVKKFLLDNQKNGGVLDLLYKYLVELSARSELLWPPGLIDVYLAGYNRSREHFTLPSLFTQNTEFEAVKDQGLMTLMYMELKMDKWHAKDPADALSSSSLKGCNSNNLEQDIGKYFWEDMDFLLQMSVLKCVLGDYLETFVMRAFWVKGRFYILEGDIENAVRCFEQLIDVIEETEEETKKPVKHGLINCSSMNVITKDLVKEQLESLQRCQSLEEVHRLYEQGDFQAVVDLLIATFRQAQARRKVSNDGNIPERHAQLKLLHDSLWKLENYQDCLIWGEAGFDEALTQYMIVLSASERTVWAETMSHLLSGLDKCINVDKELLDKMSKTKLIRLANNLINLISLQMLVAETALESEIPTVSPWILLYHVIKHEELKIQNESTQASNSPKRNEIQIADSTPKLNPQEGDFGLGVPSSLMLLLTAHECLGRFSWCSGSDGALLLLSVDIMSTELQRSTPANPNPFREDLESGLEQCFYCLYGHPNKRTKAKHLQEHNAQSIPLTWERSLLLFEYFKPNVLPEFDSYRTNAVSAELENLLRRISSLIPTEEDPLARTDGITAYIEGGTDKLPPFASDKSPPSPIVKDLYYLLGDYYFKNKEFGKAIKYYTLDICVNTHRFDSWAGMALARSSQLEQKLSCCDLKNEGAIYRKSTSALRCFKQALELDSTHTSLWIEYGSIAYMLHSHTSRQLKQQSQLNFGDDVLELLQKKKEEMLSTAENCFLSAKQCEIEGVEVDEVWLHHYMLGKIAEKKSDHPKVYLEHYKQAAKYLHEDEARYPKKIHYHNPPELSIEALEIYHRTHVSILKYLFRHKETLVSQDDLELFQGYLTEAASSPFAKFQEKSERDSRYTSLSSSEAEDTSLALPTSKRRAKKAAAVARDHDYFQGQKQLSNNIKLESSRQRHHRVSIDSSSESQDSAAVKDVLNSIVAVVSESANENEDQGGPTIVLGDHKIHKLINKKDDIISIPNSPYSAITPDSNLVSDTPMQEQMKVSSDESNNLIIDSAKAAKFMGKSNRDKEVLTKTEEQENVTKIQETIEEFALPKSNYDLPSSKPLLQSTTNLIGNFEIESKSVECIALIEIEKINDELKEIVKKQELERRGITSESTEKTPVTVGDIFEQCLTAVKNCLQRFTQHYKSLYRIAHYYFYSTKSKNLPLAREVLLGSSNGHTAIGHQGLFSERKNTNFFNGIWRIPIDEIDRPGSFGAHMYRSIVLLMEVLDQLEDHAMLLHLTVQLNRIPDLGKKYLRDTDRAYLARETFSRCLKVHRNQLNSLLQEEPPPEETRLISCLLDIFRTWHSLQKAAVFPELANELLEEAYSMYKLGEVDPSPPVLEQAIRFCQVQQLKQSNSQITQDLSRNLIISGIFIKPAENVIDALATPYTAITSTTEAPTNEVGQTANEQKLENLATLFVSQNPALSLAYISPLELQPGEAVATSSQTPSAFRSQYHSSNITSYISCPVQMSETVPTISTIAEPASAMNVISGARYMAPYASINTMRKRWQTHGGRRHRFGVAAPKSYIQMPLIKTDINTKQVFPTITDIEKQHVDKK